MASKRDELLSQIRGTPTPPPQPSPKLEGLIAAPPDAPRGPPAVHAALPNTGRALATDNTFSLYPTDLDHIDLIEARIRKLGYRRVTPSLAVKVGLRVAANALQENPALPLGKWVEEATAEDKRRHRHRAEKG
jgi:hypothetical protein